MKNKMNPVIKQLKKHENDTGSVAVQVGLLTEDIKKLSDHLEKNPKDFSSKRGLLKKVNRRKTYLKYLEKNNQEQYKHVIDRLELRK